MPEHCPDHSALMETVGEIKATVGYIKGKIDNGLSAKLESVDKTLTKFMDSAAAQRRIDRAENWFARILQGSATKIIGLVIVFIMLSAVSSSGLTIFLKNYYSQETPGQQKEILIQGKQIEAQAKDIQTHAYHQHTLIDGRILFHTGDANMRAYILDPQTGKYERAPYMRTEGSIK